MTNFTMDIGFGDIDSSQEWEQQESLNREEQARHQAQVALSDLIELESNKQLKLEAMGLLEDIKETIKAEGGVA